MFDKTTIPLSHMCVNGKMRKAGHMTSPMKRGGGEVISVKEAKMIVEEFRNMNGQLKTIKAPIFKETELGRAETIVNALEGLTIESAQDLLNRVHIYLLQDIVS